MFATLLKEENLYRRAIFGLHRVNAKLTQGFQPISPEEIEAQVQSYSNYIQSFSGEQASRWPLAHLVVRDGTSYDLSTLDRWYVRETGEWISGYLIYDLQLRVEKERYRPAAR